MTISDNRNTYNIIPMSAQNIANALESGAIIYDGPTALRSSDGRCFIAYPNTETCRETGESEEWLHLWQEQA